MFIQQSAIRGTKLMLIVSVLWWGVLGPGPAMAQPQGSDAKSVLKAMLDYMSSQKTIEITFDSDIEVITPQLEKIQFTNSGEMLLSRPDKLRAHRLGGYADVALYFDGKTRAQAPLYSVQGHVIYNLPYGIWVGLDGTYYTGGRTTIDGVENDDVQKNSRLGVTIALPVDRHHSVKLYVSTGASTRTGGDFDTVGIIWQYRWGGGL